MEYLHYDFDHSQHSFPEIVGISPEEVGMVIAEAMNARHNIVKDPMNKVQYFERFIGIVNNIPDLDIETVIAMAFLGGAAAEATRIDEMARMN